MTPPVRLAPG